MNKLDFKEDELGKYIEKKDGSMLLTVSDQFFKDVKLEDIVDKKKLVESLYQQLDKFSFDKVASTDDSFARNIYSNMVKEKINEILGSHNINEKINIYGYDLNDVTSYDDMIGDICCDVDFNFDNSKIEDNLGINGIVEYCNELYPEVDKKADEMDEISNGLINEDPEYMKRYKDVDANDAQQRCQDLNDLASVLHDYFATTDGFAEELGHALAYFAPEKDDYIITAKDDFSEECELYSPELVNKLVKSLRNYMREAIKEIGKSYNFNQEMIYNEAIKKIKESEIYNDLDVKTELDDVKGLEIDYSKNNAAILLQDNASNNYNDIDLDELNNLHGRKI